MPYAPGTQYRGDAYLFQGISQAGDGVAKAIGNFRRDREESQFLDQQVESLAAAAAPLLQSGELDPKVQADLEKFPGMSLSKKRGTAANVAFQIQRADQMRREKADIEDRGLRREIDLGRVRMEEERFNQGARELATERAGRESFNVGLSEFLDIPETNRRPWPEAVLGIAARSGVATPAMAAGMEDARLRDAELGVRNRAVAVQERQAGVMEGKLDMAADGVGVPKPEAVQRMMNEILLRLTDPMRAPNPEQDRVLRQRLTELQAMIPGAEAAPAAAAPAAAKKLDVETAKAFLKQAGGDKAKARTLAKEAGYQF